jgi:hypothetical protein
LAWQSFLLQRSLMLGLVSQEVGARLFCTTMSPESDEPNHYNYTNAQD